MNFHASVYPEAIHKDELVTYRMVIENITDLRNITPPPFKDFILVSGPNEESGIIKLNGAMTHYMALSFILKPRKTGKLVIGRSEVTVGSGKILKSLPLKLTVKNSLSGSSNNLSSAFPSSPEKENKRSGFNSSDYILKRGDNVTEKVKRNMQLRLSLDKKKCYVGEPVVACYKLYSRLKSDSRMLANPSFNGFSVVDLQAPDVTAYENEKIDGREFNAYTIRKAQLYPLQPGTIQVESAELENRVQFINEGSRFAERDDMVERFDAFGGSAFISAGDITDAVVNLASKPESIEVLPLPEANKPASFKGAVGDFEIHAEVRSDHFTSDQSGLLVLTISGKGNLQLVTAPDISWPLHLESFEPKASDEMVMSTVPVSGKRKFEYVFSADTSGNYTVPEILFSYFDPQSETYKTIRSKPINISVTAPTISVKESNLVLPVKKTSWLNELLGNRPLIAGIVAGLILAGVGFYAFRTRKTEKEFAPEGEMPTEAIPAVLYSNRHNPLEASGHCITSGNVSGFYSSLHSDIRNFLADKMKLTPQEISARTIDNYLEKQTVPNEYALELQKLMHEIEWHLYAPGSDEDIQAMYGKAQSLIQSLNMYCLSCQ